MLFFCDLIGVFAFAFLGSREALKKQHAIGIVLLCGFLTALGGGTVRSLLLGAVKPFYIDQPIYGAIVALAVLCSVLTYRRFDVIKSYILCMDAIGMVAFAHIGVEAAVGANLGFGPQVFFAFLTAAGGGLLADLIIGGTPQIFRQNAFFYLAPPIMYSVGYWVFAQNGLTIAEQAVLISAAFAAQVAAIFMQAPSLYIAFRNKATLAVYSRL